MSAAVHFLDHSMHRHLCLGVRESILIILLIEGIIPIVRVRVVYYAVISSLASLEIIPLVAPETYPFILRIDNKFKPPLSDRGFSFEGFFQNPYTVITQQFILLAIDSFF